MAGEGVDEPCWWHLLFSSLGLQACRSTVRLAACYNVTLELIAKLRQPLVIFQLQRWSALMMDWLQPRLRVRLLLRSMYLLRSEMFSENVHSGDGGSAAQWEQSQEGCCY